MVWLRGNSSLRIRQLFPYTRTFTECNRGVGEGERRKRVGVKVARLGGKEIRRKRSDGVTIERQSLTRVKMRTSKDEAVLRREWQVAQTTTASQSKEMARSGERGRLCAKW